MYWEKRERIFQEIIAQTSQKTKPPISISKRFNRTQNKVNTKRSTSKHIILKLVKEKEKNLKAASKIWTMYRKNNMINSWLCIRNNGGQKALECSGWWTRKKLSTKNSITRKLLFNTEGEKKNSCEFFKKIICCYKTCLTRNAIWSPSDWSKGTETIIYSHKKKWRMSEMENTQVDIRLLIFFLISSVNFF